MCEQCGGKPLDFLSEPDPALCPPGEDPAQFAADVTALNAMLLNRACIVFMTGFQSGVGSYLVALGHDPATAAAHVREQVQRLLTDPIQRLAIESGVESILRGTPQGDSYTPFTDPKDV